MKYILTEGEYENLKKNGNTADINRARDVAVRESVRLKAEIDRLKNELRDCFFESDMALGNISKLREENEKLESDARWAIDGRLKWKETAEAAEAEIKQLKEENVRLRDTVPANDKVEEAKPIKNLEQNFRGLNE